MTASGKYAMRDAYGEVLVELGGKYENMVVLDADVSHSTQTIKFAQKYPDRFINVGCAEQNLMGTAAGLASEGKTVFASSFAVFASGRAWDTIRNIVAHDRLNVNITATHAGLSVGPDGSSHQALEDVALMRAVPGMTVLSPADAIEVKALLRLLPEREGPSYTRLARAKTPLIYENEKDCTPQIGKAVKLRDGCDVTLISTGLMAFNTLEAASALEKKHGVSARVLNMHTIKPIDEEAIADAAAETGAIVTVEEHSVYGGLGSAVAESASSSHPVPVRIMGVRDTFGESGTPEELFGKHHLTLQDIVEESLRLIGKKA